jgi:hypothetical protein
MGDLIVFFGVEGGVVIHSQVFAQVHIVGIGAEVFAVERFNNDGAFFYFFQYPGV